MTIRTKIVGAICIVFLLAVSIFYFASYGLILKQFLTIEHNNAVKDNSSAVNALENQVKQLRLKGVDWAYWDDTYRFINDHNQAYIDSNVQDSALTDLNINFMLFYDLKGNLVLSKGVDLVSGNEIPIPSDLSANFKTGSPLLKTASDGDGESSQGILGLAEGPAVMIALPILTTDSQGPARGTVVFAQYLNDDAVANLKKLTNLNLGFDSYNHPPSGLASLAKSLVVGKASVVPLNSIKVASYSLVNDVYGKPLLITSVVDNRDVYQQGRHSIAIFLTVITAVSIITLLIALYITNKLLQKDQVIQLKNEFFSIASHELRTPLTAIRGNSSMLLDLNGGELNPNQKLMAQSIYQSSTELIKVVNHFLDAARLEQGKINLYPSPFQLGEVVQAVVSELGNLAHAKGLTLTVENFDGLPPVYADRERTREVIYNLVGNSMKYTERGGVTVTAKPNAANIEVYIVDTGLGMSDSEKQKLFTKFQTGQYAGVGLGLYISKMLTQKMNGQMKLVESEVGRGTTFMFSLPFAQNQSLNVSATSTISELSQAAVIKKPNQDQGASAV